MSTISDHYDAVFLGGGLASGMMARYLKREHPELNILVVEKNTTTHYNPGESTVGVAGMFFIRDLGLSTYLYVNHLPKCGLRYLFHDRETHNGAPFDVTACSEIGPNILPIFPTFQVDRKRLDEDLWRLNKEIGIEVETGTLVTDVEFGEGDALHKVHVSSNGEDRTIETRWVVNSLGRGSKTNEMFDRLSPITIDDEHLAAGAWGRFTNTKDIDLLGDDAWRKKVGYTARYLSTNHFMGRGFWIWAIPIGNEVVSWGIVYDKNIIQDLTQQDAFVEFLKEQPLVAELLEDAEIVDFQSHPHLTWKRESLCSTDRWACVGDAHGFLDPFYSPGCDVLSRQAYLLEHLIPEQSPEQLKEKVDLINEYAWHEYDLVKLLYKDQYNGFGSFEIFNIKSLWDFHSYTNRLLWYFFDRKYRDGEFIKAALKTKDKTMELTAAIQDGFRDLALYLTETGQYERQNLGKYSLRQNRFRIEEEMLTGYDDAISVNNHFQICKFTVSELIESRFEIDGFRTNLIAQHELSVAELSGFKLNEAWLETFCGKVAHDLERQLHDKFGANGYHVTVDAESFSQPIPKGLETSPEEVKNYATDLWQEKAVNSVVDSLITGHATD
jgi:flavin-dependent dehydrogenase